MTDPIADLLTRIRNAVQAKHESLVVPRSKIKLAILTTPQGLMTDGECRSRGLGGEVICYVW